MAGSDLPSGGSGATSPPPSTPPKRSAKRKRGDSAGPPSLPSRATRSSAPARKALVGVLRMARRAGVGALWTARTGRGRGRGRGFGDVERMREVILGVRLARSVRVSDDDPDSPYPEESRRSGSRSSERVKCKISYLSSYPEKRAGTEPAERASIPEWKNPSDEETDDYKAASLTELGTTVCPPNLDISATDEVEKTRKEWVDKCDCSHPGSEDCVRVHVERARRSIKDQLGEEVFKNCGLDAMGEQVGELWTAVDKNKFEDVAKLVPQNKHQTFMKIALEELVQKETKDSAKYLKETKNLAKYYHNVFLPRRLASLTRAEHKKDEAIDTDGEESGQDDYNNEHRPRKKSRSSGSSSSTRCKKYKSRKYLMSGTTVTLQRKKN